MYRTAREIVHRDMNLLVSNDRGIRFSICGSAALGYWRVPHEHIVIGGSEWARSRSMGNR